MANAQVRKIGLKGFANFGIFPTVEESATTYGASGTKICTVGASKCNLTDNKEDFSIKGDDGIYDEGAEWTSTTLEVTIHESTLAALATLTGCTVNELKTAIEEGTLDIPQTVALVYSALRRDGGYRCYRYYKCKLKSYKVDHSTKGTSNDGQPYILTFSCTPRQCDNMIRGTEDVENSTAASTWLASIPAVAEQTPTPPAESE